MATPSPIADTAAPPADRAHPSGFLSSRVVLLRNFGGLPFQLPPSSPDAASLLSALSPALPGAAPLPPASLPPYASLSLPHAYPDLPRFPRGAVRQSLPAPDSSDTLSAVWFTTDHLRLVAAAPGSRLPPLHDRLQAIAADLARLRPVAYDPSIGHLVSSAFLAGNAVAFEAWLFLPAMSRIHVPDTHPVFDWFVNQGVKLAPLPASAPRSSFYAVSLHPGLAAEDPSLLARAFTAVATALLQADAAWLADFHASHPRLLADRAARALETLQITRRLSVRRALVYLADLAAAHRFGLSPVPLPDPVLLRALSSIVDADSSPRRRPPLPDALRAALDIPFSNKEPS